jgi:hypothetical protein
MPYFNLHIKVSIFNLQLRMWEKNSIERILDARRRKADGQRCIVHRRILSTVIVYHRRFRPFGFGLRQCTMQVILGENRSSARYRYVAALRTPLHQLHAVLLD